ncbi:Metallo-dependent phosphatase [Pisolithus sp. B1]|nr:Metallo-dependent phosphatase [Pisolithus sp. B1]
MGLLRDRRSHAPRLRSRRIAIFTLRLFWVISTIWCEFGVFFYSLVHCRWPDKVLQLQVSLTSTTKPTRVLLVADAQVPNPAAVGSPWFREDAVTSYLRKSWSVTYRLHPDVVIFLGDTLSSGRYIRSKEEYDSYYRRFESIFQHGNETTFYFVPGNNDIGLGQSSSFSKDASQFFAEYFGPLNQAIAIAGHKFVLIDAPKLVEEDYQRHAHDQTFQEWTPLSGGPIAFLRSTADTLVNAEPVVLLTHIPLSRRASKSCGPLREKGSISAGAGRGYQNMLGKQTTEYILKALQPSVFIIWASGDNRDYCEVMHAIPGLDGPGSKAEVREVTVKSFSPSRHIRWPGFQLVSLIPPIPESSSGPTIADTSCHLPDTVGIYRRIYLPSLVLTLIALLYLNLPSRSHHRRPSSLSAVSGRRPSGPESAIWSTWSPHLPRFLKSPTDPLLTSPSAKDSHYHVTSQSGTPQPSPLLSPIALFSPQDEIEDLMTPTHSAHRNHEDNLADFWITDRENGREHSDAVPAFLPQSRSSQPSRNRRWCWWLPFDLRGRRRCITIRIPGRDNHLTPGGHSSLFGAQELLWGFACDGVSVAFAALLSRLVVGWMFSSV